MSIVEPYKCKLFAGLPGTTPHWRVIGPGLDESDLSYGDRALCAVVCDLMNRAYRLGLMDGDETSSMDCEGEPA